MDYTLLNILREMTAIEKYKKKPKFKGIVKEKKFSKKGNIILIIKKQKYEEGVLVIGNNLNFRMFSIDIRLFPNKQITFCVEQSSDY